MRVFLIWCQRHPVLLGALASALYGLCVRVAFTSGMVNSFFGGWFMTASLGFLFGAPLVMGYLALMGHALKLKTSPDALPDIRFAEAIFLPWLPTLVSFCIISAMGFEVMICLIMAAPIVFFMGSLGGVFAWLMLQSKDRPYYRVLSGILFLPMVGSGLESQLPQQPAYYEVHNQIAIAADAETVWQHIERVDTIRPEEQTHSYLHDFGFPRPLEATLSHTGVGGVRHASFENNILFVETITDWDKPHRLSFEIVPELSKTRSPVVNDKILGGRYFDVLEGTYTLEPQGEHTLLHLTSKQRVSTFYNVYSSLWTRWIMSELQGYILRVIQQRCEAETLEHGMV